MMHLLSLLLIVLPLLAACVTGPGFPVDSANTGLQAREAARAQDGARGETVIWGGRIIHTKPEAETTRIEVLAYPLQRNQKPDTGAASEGRFLIIQDGYLEPADYTDSRLVTVIGSLQQPLTGRIDDADYRYPVVRADSLHLWPEQRTLPRVRFGVGVMISR